MLVMSEYLTIERLLTSIAECIAPEWYCANEYLEERLALSDQPAQFFGNWYTTNDSYVQLFHKVGLNSLAARLLERTLHNSLSLGVRPSYYEFRKTGEPRFDATLEPEILSVLRGQLKEFEIARGAHDSGESTPQRPNWTSPKELEGLWKFHTAGFRCDEILPLLNKEGIPHQFTFIPKILKKNNANDQNNIFFNEERLTAVLAEANLDSLAVKDAPCQIHALDESNFPAVSVSTKLYEHELLGHDYESLLKAIYQRLKSQSTATEDIAPRVWDRLIAIVKLPDGPRPTFFGKYFSSKFIRVPGGGKKPLIRKKSLLARVRFWQRSEVI